MYSGVSQEFLDVLARPSRHFAARFTYSNGNFVDLNIRKIITTTGSCGTKLAVGCAYAGHIEVTADYSDILLEGQELFLEIGLLKDNNTYEYVPFGYWTVQKPTKRKDVMTFQAVDRMAGKFNADYETELTYPTSVSNVLSEFSEKTGVQVICNMQTSSVMINAPIEGVTQRGALAVIAATLLGNAWIDRYGRVNITPLISTAEIKVNYDYVKEEPEMDETATSIQGVKVYTVAGKTDTWIERGSGNQIVLSDVYMTESNLDLVKSNVMGVMYGGGRVTFMGNPLIDPSDRLYFRGGSDMQEYMLVTHWDAEIITNESESLSAYDFRSYDVPCMEIVQTFDGGLLTSVTAPGQFVVTETTYTVGPVTEELRRQQTEITNTQISVETAQTTADNAMTMANGKNKIFYQNDAPTTGVSAGDMWFDTDGGNAIYEYVEGTGWSLRQFGQGSIAAGSITALELNVQSLSAISAYLGNVIVGGLANEDGSIIVNNASGTEIGRLDKDGIVAQSGRIGPWVIGANGIYNGLSSFLGTTDGTYIGTDGIKNVTDNGTRSYQLAPGGNFIIEDTASDGIAMSNITLIKSNWVNGYSYRVDIMPFGLEFSKRPSGGSYFTPFNLSLDENTSPYMLLQKDSYGANKTRISSEEIEIAESTGKTIFGSSLIDTYNASQKRVVEIDGLNGVLTLGKDFNAKTVLYSSGDIELVGAAPQIDFRYGYSTADFTARLAANEQGLLDCIAALKMTGRYLIGTEGTDGYIRIARLTISYPYSSRPIEIVYSKRNTSSVSRLNIQFTDANTVDPTLASFTEWNQAGTVDACIYKSSTSTWDVYVRKDGGWGSVNVISVSSPENVQRITVNLDGTQVNSLPSGVVWATIISTSAATTSDRRLKKDFEAYDHRYEAFFMGLKPMRYRMLDGDSGNYHSGFVAQDVEDALIESGLAFGDFAGLEIGKVSRADYAETMGNTQYYLRYNEFIGLNTWMIQQLMKRVDRLEGKA